MTDDTRALVDVATCGQCGWVTADLSQVTCACGMTLGETRMTASELAARQYQDAMRRAQAGLCSHGGHGFDGDTCSEIPVIWAELAPHVSSHAAGCPACSFNGDGSVTLCADAPAVEYAPGTETCPADPDHAYRASYAASDEI